MPSGAGETLRYLETAAAARASKREALSSDVVSPTLVPRSFTLKPPAPYDKDPNYPDQSRIGVLPRPWLQFDFACCQALPVEIRKRLFLREAGTEVEGRGG